MNNEVIALKRSLFYPKTDLDLDNEQCLNLHFVREELVEVYQSSVKDLAENYFGKRGATVTPLPIHGTFHLIYRVSFDEHERYIVKIMLPELPLPKTAFLIDKWVYKLLSQQSLPSLQVHVVDYSQQDVSFSYEIVEFVKGMPLSILEDPSSQLLPMGILSSLGALIAQMHQLFIDGFGPVVITEYQNELTAQGVHRFWSDYIFCYLNKHIETCCDIGAISFAEAEQVRTLFMDHSYLFECQQGVLLHGDLGHHNIFSDGARVTAIIDWEDCMSGDPIFDLAYWGTFVKDHMREEFLNGYKKHAVLPADFEVRYWLYYLRISLSKTVHRYRFGHEDRPGCPPASARIQKALMYLHNLGA